MINTVPFFHFPLAHHHFQHHIYRVYEQHGQCCHDPPPFCLATELHIQPVILVLPATIAVYGFMLPAGTLPNAMVFFFRLVPQKDMLKSWPYYQYPFSIILVSFFYLVLAS